MAEAEAVERPVSLMITGDTPYAVANIPLPSTGDTPYTVANIPLPASSDDDIREPRAPYMASSFDPLTSDSPRESYLNNSETLLGNKGYTVEDPATSPISKRRSLVRIAVLLVALALVIVLVVVPVYFAVIKPKLDASKSNTSGGVPGSKPGGGSGGGGGGSTPTPGSPIVTTGGNGSTIHAADGTTFIYNNPFGGFCKFFTFFFCPTGNC